MSINEQIARRFSKLVAEYVGTENMQHIIVMNRDETDTNICHSHDFCDANVFMCEAIIDITGIVPSDNDCDMWNRAWDTAKKAEFYGGSHG